MHKKRSQLYKSRKHLAVVFFFILAPFIFLYTFARVAHLGAESLFFDIFISMTRMIIAYSIAVVIAWLLGITFYHGKRSLVALPVFDVLQSFPTFAALPLAVYFWGSSTLIIIWFLTITILWPILFSIISSLHLIRSDWEDVVKIEGLRGFNYFKHFLWPISLPGLITGSIVGLGDGWGALIATEVIINKKTGLGNFFQQHSNDTLITAFGILGFLIIIFSINKLLWTPLMEWSRKLTEE